MDLSIQSDLNVNYGTTFSCFGEKSGPGVVLDHSCLPK